MSGQEADFWLGLKSWLAQRTGLFEDSTEAHAKRLLAKERRQARLKIEKEEPVQLQMVDYDRGMGVLLPIFSLPSPYGIGTLGKAAYAFVDFLHRAGVRYWQILPLNPTGYGDSPYAGTSSWAGNPYFIDLDLLVEEGMLRLEEIQEILAEEGETSPDPAPAACGDSAARSGAEPIDYGLLFRTRQKLLYQAYLRRPEAEEAARRQFAKDNAYWLRDYALYVTIKEGQGMRSWQDWPEDLRLAQEEALERIEVEEKEKIDFLYWVQFQFYRQWEQLKSYAVSKGISFIGDIPIYVAMDSADVWRHPEVFLLDAQRKPLALAGAPPDFYNKDGQLWGNPIYDWQAQAADGYGFWTARLAHSLLLYHVLRLDHFLGFAHYWRVDPQEETAKNGYFEKGPGMDFFHAMEEKLGPLPILVEDLGVVDEDVLTLRQQTGFPGMRPIVFAFGGEDSEYLPHNYLPRTSVYTSTHDSVTLKGWWDEGTSQEEKRRVQAYFGLDAQEGYLWGILRGVCSSVADLCIFPMQDLLMLGNEARINVPGRLGNNWSWRLAADYGSGDLADRLREMARMYGRI